ncbi:hypothetical protein M513_07791 [Trichuris suis]|uniref:Uncharacterized protein n=1 Tax=Trichuris suis TaxID=68888 RepID=A0A085M2E0_9BILA|nr:hypothetical protein M513_07791 [Trichuris suis]
MFAGPPTDNHITRACLPYEEPEAFCISHNPSVNRDKCVEVSKAWADQMNQSRPCALTTDLSPPLHETITGNHSLPVRYCLPLTTQPEVF